MVDAFPNLRLIINRRRRKIKYTILFTIYRRLVLGWSPPCARCLRTPNRGIERFGKCMSEGIWRWYKMYRVTESDSSATLNILALGWTGWPSIFGHDAPVNRGNYLSSDLTTDSISALYCVCFIKENGNADHVFSRYTIRVWDLVIYNIQTALYWVH